MGKFILVLVVAGLVLNIFTNNVSAHGVSSCERFIKLHDQADSITQTKNNGVEKMNQVIDRLNNLVSTLEEKNIDVTKIKVSIKSLKERRDTFEENYQQFMYMIEESQIIACGDLDNFNKSLQLSRERFFKTRFNYEDFWNYLKSTVIPDLGDISKKV